MACMLEIFCRAHHVGGQPLCSDCAALLDYSHKRLAACPYQERKPTCKRCPIHCYTHWQRNAVKAVMAYAGPRMLAKHPLLAAAHVVDSLRSPRKFK